MWETDRRIVSARNLIPLLFAPAFIFAFTATLVADDPTQALRERYLGPAGLPSETAYAHSHGALPAPDSESFAWDATFKLIYRTTDLARLADAQPVHADCYFTRRRKYVAPARVQPVWDGRAYQAGDRLVVAAYTHKGERIFGHVDEHGNVVRDNDVDKSVGMPDLSDVKFNPFTGQLWRSAPGGAIDETQQLYLPLNLTGADGRSIDAGFEVIQTRPGEFALVTGSGADQIKLATCTVRPDSDAKRSRGYAPALGPGCSMVESGPTTVLEVRGDITDVLDIKGARLVSKSELPISKAAVIPKVQIDGRFDEWRNIRGITDPQGDIVSYLQYNPDIYLI
jgi:hypothetical protein